MSEQQYGILALILRYWFILLIAYILYISIVKTFSITKYIKDRKRTTGNIPFVLSLFTISAFGLLAGNSPAEYDYYVLFLGVLVSAIIVFQFYFLYNSFEGLDEVILTIVDTLFILGLIMLHRLSPELAAKQVYWFLIANIGLFIFMLVFSRDINLTKIIYPMMIIGILVLLIVLFFGEEEWGAKRFISLGSISIQPSEFFKILFILVLAFWLNERKNFINNLPIVIFSILSVILVVLHKDLGSALQYFIVFIFVYYISSSDWKLTLVALITGASGSILSYKLFPHVRVRVHVWRNPWSDIYGGGYQVAQSLIAIGSGGPLGLGLGMGKPHVIPASRTDFIFAAICEEFGIIIGISVILFFSLILIRGMKIAVNAFRASDMLFTCGATISIVIQAFIIIGGVIKLIPLTGITLPFVSYGGSSMFVSMCIIGIIQGVTIKNRRLSKQEQIETSAVEEGGSKHEND